MARRRPGRHRSRKRIPPPPAQSPGVQVPPEAGAVRPTAVKPGSVDPLIGRVLARCRLEERIGIGRTAVVYRAHHEALDATVAVKILLPKAAANDEIVRSFETEARAIARIDNENVLKIYDVGAEGDLHYIVMELLEGDSVQDLIERDEQLDVMDALRVTRQAAAGLVAAHGSGILHRDVKPQNLVLLEDGTVKLVDFGLAGATQGDVRRVGTPHFMAPETCQTGHAEARSDIYSLGITLHHMLVGRPPYMGQEVAQIMKSHIRGDPLRPERGRPTLPRAVADLVRDLTAREPADRPSAAEVVDRLDEIGGRELKEKGTLRRRRSRMRTRVATRKERSSSAGVIWAVILAAIAGAVFLILKARGG